MSMTSDDILTLRACPMCGYSLSGLPTTHRCPECGFAYDRRWRIFGRRQTMWPISILLLFIAGLTLCSMISMGVNNAVVITSTGFYVLIAVLVILGRDNFGQWIAITPIGVQVFRGKRFLRRIGWEKIVVARAEPRIGLQVIDAMGNAVNLRGAGTLLVSGAREIADAINAYPYKQGGETETSQDATI